VPYLGCVTDVFDQRRIRNFVELWPCRCPTGSHRRTDEVSQFRQGQGIVVGREYFVVLKFDDRKALHPAGEHRLFPGTAVHELLQGQRVNMNLSGGGLAGVALVPDTALHCNKSGSPLRSRMSVQTDNSGAMPLKKVEQGRSQAGTAEGLADGVEGIDLDVDQVKSFVGVQLLQKSFRQWPARNSVRIVDRRAFAVGIQDFAVGLEVKRFAQQRREGSCAGTLTGDHDGIGHGGALRLEFRSEPLGVVRSRTGAEPR
jgi:hypothetical protein